MNMYDDENAQTGTILFIIIGLFLMGIFYVLLGSIMNGNQDMNNDLISNNTMPYSQERRDMMDGIYLYWWSFPIYMLALFIIYGIKKAIDKQSGVV